jgi:FkbM family methyltransferase
MLKAAGKIVNASLGHFGMEVRRKEDRTRATMFESLRQAAQNGLSPQTVIDVGAAHGTPPLYDLFPEARFILLEPLDEFAPALNEIARGLKHAECLVAAVTSKPGRVVLNVHPDLMGSSLCKEEEGAHVDGIERTVPAVTLNDVCAERGTRPPYLIKVDTQGSELQVLEGADRIMAETDVIVLEASLFGFFKGGPQILDILLYMKERGFILYDVFDLQYRPLDGAMAQVDLAFVQERSKFRASHAYATRNQREQMKRFLGAR